MCDELGFVPLEHTGAHLLFRFAAAYERRSLGMGSHWPFGSWPVPARARHRQSHRPAPTPLPRRHPRRQQLPDQTSSRTRRNPNQTRLKPVPKSGTPNWPPEMTNSTLKLTPCRRAWAC
jgi:hypothetical protein